MTNIAVLGCGTVAGGVFALLEDNKPLVSRRAGEDIYIKKVLARTVSKPRSLGFCAERICTDIDDILHDNEIDIVVELIGGVDTAFDYVSAALRSKKHVVTANKDLIERRFDELHALALDNGVELRYEAAVAGAIPIVTPLLGTLCANRFSSIIGILNGTTNYILTRMTQEGCSYSTALEAAQQLGFAERNPDADVLGADAARKIAILARIAYGSHTTLSDVSCDGITELGGVDVALASRLGYTIKLIAGAIEQSGGLVTFVRPAFVPQSHPLASVSGSFNAVFLNGDSSGELMLYGRGAGAAPTASSVVGDIIGIVRDIRAGMAAVTQLESSSAIESLPVSELVSVFCVRMLVDDRPRVLAGVALAFADSGVSLASLVQQPLGDGTAELVLVTHPHREADVNKSIDELLLRDYVRSVRKFLCLARESA
ncbi:MAG: homoserine dehydrogenase [Oscillospiraceae bacterium]